MRYENALTIYTDGSSYSHPRRGGIAIRYVTLDEQGNEVVEDDEHTGHQGATNNEMELLACIRALQGARDHPKIGSVECVYIVTDSMYVTSNLPRAKFEWSKRQWLNRNGRPVENATLWKDLIRLIKKIPKRVEFKWVKGHGKNVHNKAVDKLAKRSAKGVLNPPLKVTSIRRKKSSAGVVLGCVPMRSQTAIVRIITDTYLRVQNIYKYKYEVLEGEFRGKVDLIFSAELLRAGHEYEVIVNDNTKNPRIIQLVRELDRS